MKKKNNVRYWSRDEIEQIVKNRHIDRTRFYEYSKTDYERVIKKFYYSFCEYEKDTDIILDYCWIRFRENLEITGNINDFYIVSLQFDRMAVYCDDGDCIVYYKK